MKAYNKSKGSRLKTFILSSQLGNIKYSKLTEIFGCNYGYFSQIYNGHVKPGAKMREKIYRKLKEFYPDLQYEDLWMTDEPNP